MCGVRNSLKSKVGRIHSKAEYIIADLYLILILDKKGINSMT